MQSCFSFSINTSWLHHNTGVLKITQLCHRWICELNSQQPAVRKTSETARCSVMTFCNFAAKAFNVVERKAKHRWRRVLLSCNEQRNFRMNAMQTSILELEQMSSEKSVSTKKSWILNLKFSWKYFFENIGKQCFVNSSLSSQWNDIK